MNPSNTDLSAQVKRGEVDYIIGGRVGRRVAPKHSGSYRVVLLFCPRRRYMSSSSKKSKPKASSSKRVARHTVEPVVVEGEDDNTDQEMKIPTGMPPEPWHRSPSPFESWSDYEDTSWPLKIVGEEVDGWGNIRCVDEPRPY